MHSNIYWIPVRWLDADVIKIKRKSLLVREFTAFAGRQICPHNCVKIPKTMFRGPQYVQGICKPSRRSRFMWAYKWRQSKVRVWSGLQEEIFIFWRTARSHQQASRHSGEWRVLRGTEWAWHLQDVQWACVCACVCPGWEVVGDREMGAGKGKEPGLSPEDMVALNHTRKGRAWSGNFG